MGIYSSKLLKENANIQTVAVEAQHYDESLGLLETAYTIVEENEVNWNTLMKAIALQELSFLEENHKEMVYTEAEHSDILSGFTAFFKKAFAKIKGLFDKFMAKMSSLVKSDVNFIKKYESKVLDGAKYIPDSLKFKGYTFEELKDFSLDYAISTYTVDANNLKSRIKSDLNINAKPKSINAEFINNAINAWKDGAEEEELSGIREHLCGVACTDEEFTGKFKEFLYGSPEKQELDKTYITANVSDFVEEVKTAKKTKDAAKATFETLKKTIENSINAFNSFTVEEGDVEEYTKAAKVEAEYFKKQLAIFTKANGVHLDALKAYNRQCKAICVKLVGYASQKKVHEGFYQSEVPVDGIKLV